MNKIEEAENTETTSLLLANIDDIDKSISAVPNIFRKQDNTTSWFTFEKKHLPWLLSCVPGLLTLIMGYNIGIISGVVNDMEKITSYTTFEKEILESSQSYIGGISCFFTGHISDYFGRRYAMGLSIFFLLMSNGIMLFSSYSYFTICLLARIFNGLGSGIGMASSTTYQAEILPKHARGKAMIFGFEFTYSIGLTMGYLVTFLCDNFIIQNNNSTVSEYELSWKLQVAFGFLPGVLVIIFFIWFTPESPRWLIANNREKEGMEILQFVEETKEDVNEIMREINKNMKEAEESKDSNNESEYLYHIFMRNKNLLKPFLLAISIGLISTFPGTESMIYYSSEILIDNGISYDSNLNHLSIIIVVGIAKLMGGMYAFYLIDKLGRIKLIQISIVCIFFFLIALATFLMMQFNLIYILVSIFCINFCWDMGVGSISPMLLTEILPQKIRSRGVAVSIGILRLFDSFIINFFLSISEISVASTAYCFYGFAFLTGIGVAFYFIFPLRTNGRSLEQIEAECVGGLKAQPI